jgi:hypothetical protein
MHCKSFSDIQNKVGLTCSVDAQFQSSKETVSPGSSV